MLKELLRKILFFYKPGIEISYSKINAYQSCPYKYKLVYEERLKVPPNPHISLGISIHRTLEDFHSNKSGDFDGLMDSYNKSWKNEGFNSPQQAYDYFEKGRRMLERYFRENLDRKSEILYVEKEFIFKLGRNRLRGIIDRIDRHPDGTYEVIDYKTHNEVWKQERVDADLQISIYALACEKVFGFKPDILTFYFITHGQKIATSRGKAQIEATVRTVQEVAGKIAAGQFAPDRAYCPMCDFKKTCVNSSERQKAKNQKIEIRE